jgi:DNA-binding transcriptional regulator LsrR (DeoR family)
LATRSLKPGELVRSASIARRYYLEDRPKTEIADEFGISRFKVSRILREAREKGLVRIEIGLPAEIDAELSDRLARAWSLRQAIVVTTPDEPAEQHREHLGEVAAGLLSELVEEGSVVGIGWGRTIAAMTTYLTSVAHCTVVQLTGAVGTVEVNESTVEIVRRVAAAAGGPAYPIYAPFIVDSVEAADAIRRQPLVAEAVGLFDQMTVAFIAIGSWDPPNSQLRNSLDEAEQARLQALGVRAEVCATLIDDEGHTVVADLMDRAIGISGEQLRRIPEIVAIAGGRSKTEAIRAVLKAGFVSSLVTDAAVARELLKG